MHSEKFLQELINRSTTHGMSRTPEYRAWGHMIERCHDTKNKRYYAYGARGIVVCEEWRKDVLKFFAHVGLRPSAQHQLDRINNNGNYEPGNVRWATRSENARNKRNNRRIEIDGVTRCTAEWAAISGISPGAILSRLKRGWVGKSLLIAELSGGATKDGEPIQTRLHTKTIRERRSVAMKAHWAGSAFEKRRFRITINGVTKFASEWAAENGLHLQTLRSRYARGWRDAKLLRRFVGKALRVGK